MTVNVATKRDLECAVRAATDRATLYLWRVQRQRGRSEWGAWGGWAPRSLVPAGGVSGRHVGGGAHRTAGCPVAAAPAWSQAADVGDVGIGSCWRRTAHCGDVYIFAVGGVGDAARRLWPPRRGAAVRLAASAAVSTTCGRCLRCSGCASSRGVLMVKG